MKLINSPLSAWNVLDTLFNEYPQEYARRCLPVRSLARERDIVLEADVPGVEPEKLEIAVDGRILSIKGERSRLEAEPVAFDRKFELPFAPDAEKLVAQVKNGVLSLTIPKPVAPEPKRVAVQAG